jgi:hypothetical protein
MLFAVNRKCLCRVLGWPGCKATLLRLLISTPNHVVVLLHDKALWSAVSLRHAIWIRSEQFPRKLTSTVLNFVSARNSMAWRSFRLSILTSLQVLYLIFFFFRLIWEKSFKDLISNSTFLSIDYLDNFIRFLFQFDQTCIWSCMLIKIFNGCTKMHWLKSKLLRLSSLLKFDIHRWRYSQNLTLWTSRGQQNPGSFFIQGLIRTYLGLTKPFLTGSNTCFSVKSWLH